MNEKTFMKQHNFKLETKSRLFATAIFALSTITPQLANADTLTQLLKRTARVSDDIPLQSSDDVLLRLRKLPTLHPSKDALQSAGEAALKNPEDLRAAAVLIDGAKRIDQAVPDISLRSDLLSRSGNDVLQSAGLRTEAAGDLVYLDSYFRRADLEIPSQFRRATMTDFATVAADDIRWTFWQKYVQPNKELWAGSAALTAYLVAPEMWHDAAGNITEKAVTLAGDLGGELLAAMLRGVRKGGENMGKKVAGEIPSLLGSSFITWLGVIAFVAILAVTLLAPLRNRVFSLLRRFIIGKSSRQTDADSF